VVAMGSRKMTANLLAVYGRHTDRLMVRRYLVCGSEFKIMIVLTGTVSTLYASPFIAARAWIGAPLRY